MKSFKRLLLYPKLLSCVASLLVYLNTLDSEFVYDDTRAIVQNADLLPTSPWRNLIENDFWGTPMTHNGSHKSFRPLCTLSFRLNYLFSGYDPFSYRLVNVMCHMAVTGLVVVLAEKLRVSKLASLLTGLFFGLHPIHTEAVSGTVGRADMLSALFYLLAIISYLEHVNYRENISDNNHKLCDNNGNYEKLRKECKIDESASHLKNFYLFATLGTAGCAMFSKEQGITCLGVCVVYDITRHGITAIYQPKKGFPQHFKPVLRSIALLFGALLLLLYVRATVMGFSSPAFARSDNPSSSSESFLVRVMTFTYLPVLNFVLMLRPSTLSFDWSMGAVPLIESILDQRNFISLAFYTALGVGSYKSSNTLFRIDHQVRSISKIFTLGLTMIILPFLPASNLFFYVGFVVAERVLYIPSIGFCLFMGFALAKLLESGRRYGSIVLCFTVLTLVAFGCKTIHRNGDWQNEEKLYKSGVRVNPPKALGNLGNVWTQQGKYLMAEWALRKALSHRPSMGDVHYNLGVLLQQQKRTKESISCYNQAIKHRPNMALAHMNLGIALYEDGMSSEALDILLKVEKLQIDGTKDPKTHLVTQVGSLFNAGKICVETGRIQQGISILLKAKSRGENIKYNNQQGILNLLGEAYMASNSSAQAEFWYRAALLEKPDHVPAYLTYGKLLSKNKTRINEAESLFLRAKDLSPNDSNVHLHYGLYLMDLARIPEAAVSFEKAAKLKSSDYESNFNAGVAYRQAGNYNKAEYFYRRAVKIMPQDPSSHMNLGAMLHLAGKLSEAESEYLISWKLRPGDPSTKTNIQRLHNVMIKKGLKIKPFEPS